MDQTGTRIEDAFVSNRAEEFGLDVSDAFVIPPFFDKLTLLSAKKPRIIQGGRGCGKTMLLRYLSHHTQYSPKLRPSGSRETLSIGLYWRADTQFASSLKGRNIEEAVWESAFEHIISILIAEELIAGLRSVSNNGECGSRVRPPGEIVLSGLTAYDQSLSGTLNDIEKSLVRKRREFEVWANNPKSVPNPRFLPGKRFLEGLLDEVKQEEKGYEGAVFHIFIDEYENLLTYQQKVLNSYLKHSERPLIFHIAMKRNGMVTSETTGSEPIQETADYRREDLDLLIGNTDFELFSAEVLFLRVYNSDAINSPIDPVSLKDPYSLDERRTSDYRKRVVGSAHKIFPKLPWPNVADEILTTPSLIRRVRYDIQQQLETRGSDIDIESFLDERARQATIVVPCLLARSRNTPEIVLREYRKCAQGQQNAFSGPTNWTHNFFFGQVLRIYDQARRPCPLFAGYQAYTELAHGNLRHMLELCYKALRQGDYGANQSASIPPVAQAIAARETSGAFLKDVRSSGRTGNQLYSFAMALGSLFALAHSRPAQSEPEVNHFVVRGAGLSETQEDMIREAVKWSVLFEDEETKVKEDVRTPRSQWVLNPIYAPYFNISYRKKRKLELTTDELAALLAGNFEETRLLLQKFKKKWSLDKDAATPGLFDAIEGAQ